MDAAERSSHTGDVTLQDLDHGSITLTGTTLTLTGEIDNVLVGLWMARNTPAPAVDIVDTRAVDYFGSAGMTLLVRLQQRHPLVVRTQGRTVHRVLEMSGLLSMFPIDDGNT